MALLIRSRPRVVHKQVFAEQIWGELGMSDESLARCISRIRQVLAKIPNVPERIDSVYASGYRLSSMHPPAAGRAASAALTSAMLSYEHALRLAQRQTPAALSAALRILRKSAAEYADFAPALVAIAESTARSANSGLQGNTAFIEEGFLLLAEAERMGHHDAGLSSTRAYLLDASWRFDEAEAAWQEALQQSARNPDILWLYCRHLLLIGDARSAVELLRETAMARPYNPLMRVMLTRALVHLGDLRAAVNEAETTCEDHPDSEIGASYRLAVLALASPHPAVAALAWTTAMQRDASPLALPVLSFVLAQLGQRAESLDVVDCCLACSATTACSAVLHTPALATLGETQRASQLIRAAYEARCSILPMALRDPTNASLLTLPVVQEIWKKIFVETP